ncbi:chitinase-3-like protein 1 isoform X5 [Haliotis rubra]|uniref:chitinase-3-like protein 1 isoform X5 n=1 Tax=Haliotis rubra TaxID=36100 RepID=UPI001EE5D2BC|nr:chitinase-3-like protein 1 isoform X5 [Haliotis rubra]
MRTLVFVLACFAASTYAQTCQRVVCYYTNWSQYRPEPYKFFPENIDPRLCTHINYAFAKMNGNMLAAFEWNDMSEPWAKGMYERTKDHVKAQNPNAKIMLSVGGWNMGSEPFTAMVGAAVSREEFATTSVTFLREQGFDGLDLDWEYPANRGSPAEDKHNFIELLKVLNAAFDADAAATGNERLLLTAAVAAGKTTIDSGYDVPGAAAALDFINIMTYDLHGGWDNITGHNSPLYADPSETGDQAYLNVDWAARYWESLGLPKDKLVLGLPTYGRTFTLTSTTLNSLGDSVKGGGTAGQYTREAGFLSYYEICALINAGTPVHRIASQKVPYIVSGDQWIGYDDEESLREKVRYTLNSGYGGVMVWALDLDDFTNSCGAGASPLMNTIFNECGLTAPSPATQVDAGATEAPAAAATTAAPAGGDPVVSGDGGFCDGKADGLYADSTDCGYYYNCAGGQTNRMQCASGTVYSAAGGSCDFPANVPECA